MSANKTRETDLSPGGTQTSVRLLILRPATALVFTAVLFSVLVLVRGREPFVPPAQCYATAAAGSTSICNDIFRPLEWVLWPGVAVQALATVILTAQSIRLYFLNHRRTSS
ncbi:MULTISPECIES: hypothetical protein [Rhodococcus erythropolis group]|uniref:Uncharacterized protein n=1 Tax=Rhodococcus erythropolis TaxID=1833 RepID=A0A8I0ZRG2_RHOER|nr:MULTISPECIES: hypothetical protein [Rhodococcus erythropolis group]MBH5144250.1 hypothetical protein [Rhodococcus erythropolis]MDJ0434706.1 hypothetical protein [Rhodococcus qingshengii]QEM25714.1 hypothetical protein D6M20_02410 [Rhodococcus qingshengii]